MRLKLLATISARRSIYVDVLAQETFVGPYMGPLEKDALAWARQHDGQVMDALAETGQVSLHLEWTEAA